MNARLHLRCGSLYVDAATFARFLPDRESVTLVRRDADLYVVPLADSSLGGYLCKRRTAAGDRVVHAEEFFHENGLDRRSDQLLEATWSADFAALVVPGLFEARP